MWGTVVWSRSSTRMARVGPSSAPARHNSNRDHDRVDTNILAPRLDGDTFVIGGDFGDRRPGQDTNSIRLQMTRDNLSEFGVEDLRQGRRRGLDQGHLCAPQAVECLGQLDADETGTNHCHVVDFTLHEADLEGLDVIPHVEGMNPGMFGKARESARRGACRNHEFVPLEVTFLSVRLDMQRPGFDIDCGRPPRSEDLY